MANNTSMNSIRGKGNRNASTKHTNGYAARGSSHGYRGNNSYREASPRTQNSNNGYNNQRGMIYANYTP